MSTHSNRPTLELVVESAFNSRLVAELALNADQRDGLACVKCGGSSGAMRPILDSSPQLFVHATCTSINLERVGLR